MSLPRSIVAALVLLTFAGSTLVACSAPTSPPPTAAAASPHPSAIAATAECVRATTTPPPFESPDSARTEYLDAICDVPGPLPEGEGFPALTSSDTATLTAGNFESGAFVVKAEYTWLCAWENDYLAAHTARHTAEQRLAERMILAWDASQFHRSVVIDPSDAWETNVIVPMENGDSSGVQADLSSCGGNDTVSTG